MSKEYVFVDKSIADRRLPRDLITLSSWALSDVSGKVNRQLSKGLSFVDDVVCVELVSADVALLSLTREPPKNRNQNMLPKEDRVTRLLKKHDLNLKL